MSDGKQIAHPTNVVGLTDFSSAWVTTATDGGGDGKCDLTLYLVLLTFFNSLGCSHHWK